MEPTGPVGGGQPATPPRSDTPSGSGTWQVGQILKAVALPTTASGQTQLQIGQQLVQTQSPIPLQTGQTLALQVQSLTPQPLLQILAGIRSDPVADAVRTILPKQGSVTALLNNLSQLVGARQPTLPPLLQELGQTVLRQVPEPQTVSNAPGLRQALDQSGLFLEAQLRAAAGGGGRVDFSGDFKANLLRLVQLVRNWPGLPSPSSGARPTSPAVPTAPTGGVVPTGSTVVPAGTVPTAGATTTPLPATPGGPLPTATTAGAAGTPLPAAPPQQTVAAPPTSAGQTASPNTATTPTTTARGLQASTPLPPTAAAPTGVTGITGAPAGPLGAAPALIANVVLTPPAPPMRGQAPLPQAAVQATLQALDPATTLRAELQAQAEAAVARMQLTQLASLPQDKDSGLEWLFDLPIRRGENTDAWSLQVRRDGGQGKDEANRAPSWTVQLAFDLPGLGPMQARVMLRGEQISTWFWATQAQTVPFLDQHLHELRKELESAGLEVAELSCQQGCIPKAPDQTESGPSILDERA